MPKIVYIVFSRVGFVLVFRNFFFSFILYRRKAIGLDDLLSEVYKEKNKLMGCNPARSNAPKGYNSDEDDKKTQENEITFCKFVDDCEKQASTLKLIFSLS